MNRLDDAGPLDARGEYLLVAETRENRPRVAEVPLLELVEGSIEVRVGRIDVLGDVEERAARERRIDDVGRLHDRGQRHAPVGDVQRVVGADASPDTQEEADHAEVAAVIRGRCGDEAFVQQKPCLGRGQRTEDLIEWPQPPVNDDAADAAGVSRDSLYSRFRVYLATKLPDPFFESVDERLVAALEPAHDLVPARVTRLRHAARPRPHVGRR
jgi:hypothetical protein